MDLDPNALSQILTALADLISALIWPMLVTFGLIFFREPIFNFLGNAKQISLNFLGHKISIEGDTVAPDIKELLLDIQDTVSGLTDQHRDIFEQIRSSDGRRSVENPMPGFSRKTDQQIITGIKRQKINSTI